MEKNKNRIVAEELLKIMADKTSHSIRYDDAQNFCEKQGVALSDVIALAGDCIESGDVWNNKPTTYKLSSKGVQFVNDGAWSGEDKRAVKAEKKDNKRYWINTFISLFSLAISLIALYYSISDKHCN